MTPSSPSTSTHTTVTRIQGRSYLVGARLLWLMLASISLIVYFLNLPNRFAAQLAVAQNLFAEPLSQIGLSATFYAVYIALLPVLVVMVATIVALVVFWRRSEDWVALLISAAILNFAAATLTNFSDLSADPIWYQALFVISLGTATVLLVLSFYVFPNGRLTHRPFRWIAILVAPICYVDAYFRVVDISPVIGSPTLWIPATWAVIGLWSQRYRFIHLATPAQRQQIKWIIYGMALTALPLILLIIIDPILTPWLIDRPTFRMVYRLWFNLFLVNLPLMSLPIMVGIAVLRYRLWDIDLTINRSLVGALVTVTVGGVFIASVIMLSMVLPSAQQGWSIALASAVAGILFNPTRRRIRHFIDRRFYGFRFDLNDLRKAHKHEKIETIGLYTHQKLNDYTLLGLIGEGGMGEIYASYNRHHHPVAVKVLAQKWALDASQRSRFEREAEALRRLQHPHIVQFIDHGESQGIYYIVLQYIDGIELKAYIHDKSPMSLEDALDVIHGVCQALDYIHSQGMIHRDIKPSNIMLQLNDDQETYAPILMDFGIARLGIDDTDLTGSGAVGTIDYMAPEQIQAARMVDHRADLYALGVIVYEMLTGERPFKGNPAQIMFAHLQHPPTDPRKVVATIPEKTANAILCALEKEAEKRFNSANEFLAALRP